MSEPYPPHLRETDFLNGVPVYLVRPVRRRYWLHALLFLLTVASTLIVGAGLQYNFDHDLPAFGSEADFFPLPWVWQDLSRLWLGVPFALSLLGILFAHEMGHFVYCLKYRVQATLPYFIPAPTLIGTLGAFIRIKSPIRSRQALFDIGIAGPIAGFVVAVPVMFAGLMLSKPFSSDTAETAIVFGYPLVFKAAHGLLAALGNPLATGYSLHHTYGHPLVMAAWVGMFATALNLIPGGQLDGGHIVYALWPRFHRAITRATMILLVPLGVLYWPGWLIWAVFLTLTPQHPLVPVWPGLDRRRSLLAWIAVALLLVTMMPDPFPGSSLVDYAEAFSR